MVRVKNEEKFLQSSILSIAPLVDEIVIVDNSSTDSTPSIISYLTQSLPTKVRTFSYTHELARVGEEYHSLHQENPSSPRLLHHYYAWCLRQCAMPFILKWDADMIALPCLNEVISDFKRGKTLQLDFGGENLAPDFLHTLAWKAGIEPRIFPKAFTTFAHGAYGGESLSTWVQSERTTSISEPTYLHLKYCKKDPGSNQSPEFRKALETGIQTAGPIPEAFRATLEKYLPVH